MKSFKRDNTEYTPSRIIGIQFSILSPDEILKNSVVEIKTKDTYINNYPVLDGLFDPRMGVLDPNIICPTDGLNYIQTPGYFGHIILARPMFFIQYLTEILKICKCVCYRCSKLLINKQSHQHALQMSNIDRWKYVYTQCDTIKRCGENYDGCGCKKPDSITLEGLSKIVATWKGIETGEDNIKEDKKFIFTSEIILKIFKRITDEDVNFMGFSSIWSRPDWMICQILPVCPPAVRPSVKHDVQQRSEDDLTHIYTNIIKYNNELMSKIKEENTKSEVIESLSILLQYNIAMLYDNKVKGGAAIGAQRSGRPYNCIKDRIDSKAGRIRGNLMGKRVDFSARSVITGDPNLSIRQLGVPMKIAMNITKPIVVNKRNYKFLLKLVQNGPEIYPGAKILESGISGIPKTLKYMDRKTIKLELGDIVHRHIMDGDFVLFNRQPSLHRMSMMAHEVKVMRVGDTFRFNVCNTKPYNADYDGDEMNAHFPQNIMAEIELRQLCTTVSQIISPSSNKPIIGIFQDNLLGAFRFTRPNIKLAPKTVMNYLMKFQNVNTSLFQKRTDITNFEILSQIMPPLTLKYETKLFDKDEDKKTSNNVLEIENGEYLRGQMETEVLMGGSKGIIHRIFNDYGQERTANFIDDLQNIITEYMKDSAYSVGINDLIANKKTYDEISQVIKNRKTEVKQLIDEIHLGIYKNTSGDKNIEDFELRVNNILNKATEDTGKLGRKSLNPNNRFLMIVKSGSKGKEINLSQMICCLGQQNVDGKRVPYGFDNRTLPHFQKYDDSPVSRGFVENSYISGLTATDLFFHAMCGRIGLIDTAVKTSSTGYVQRRLIKGLEDLKIEYDMTVRNSFGKIIQFAYGENGFDPAKDETQNIPLISMTIEEIYQHYNISDYELTKEIYTKETYKIAKTEIVNLKIKTKYYIDMMIESRKILIEDVFQYKDESAVKIPIHIERTIQTIQGNLNINANSLVDITPLEVYNMVENMFERIKNMFTFMPMNTPFKILYFYYLSPKYLLQKRRFNRYGIQLLLENILLKWKESIITPGEMVGVIAGQSIGEPTTQMTLNSFHTSSGSASKGNVLSGVPRVEELLRLTKNPKTPSLTISLKDKDRYEQSKAQNIANIIEYTKLADLIISSQICFEPKEDATVIPEDEMLLREFYKYEELIYRASGNIHSSSINTKSKWIVRLEFDHKILLDKNITMNDIHFAITNSVYGNDNNLTCIYSDLNSDKLIFRIRIDASLFQKQTKRINKSIIPLDDQDDINLLKTYQNALLNNIVLRGILGVKNVIPRKIQNVLTLEDGNYVKKNIWVLDTTGSNLMDVLSLDNIDTNKTYTNDVREVFDVLGVFAARQILYEEFVNVMNPTYINYHHLSLLCDRIMSTKELVPIYRTGIQNDNIGPIAKATFETHTEELLKASKHAELDPVKGVSSNIMMGQLGFFGTNSFELLFDTEQLKNLKPIDDDYIKDDDDDDNPFSELYEKNVVIDNCAKQIINIDNGVANLSLKGPEFYNQSTKCIMEDEYEDEMDF